MSHKLRDKIEYWKPLTEFFTGFLGLLISLTALIISVYAVYSASSSPQLSAYVGRHFGVAIVRGNNLNLWDLPEYDYPAKDRFLILDISVIFSNSGGKTTVVDHMELSITKETTGEKLVTEWKAFFIEPTNRDLEKRPELVTPLVVEGNASQKKLIRFSGNDPKRLLPDFFTFGDIYTFSLGVHEAGTEAPITQVKEAYSIKWEINEHRMYNITQKDYPPDSEAKSGETALLTLY